MSDENLQDYAQDEVVQQEQVATNAVAYSDSVVAEQATGYATQTPEEAEVVARQAVEAADQMVVQELYGGQAVMQSVEEAERQATAAVAATE
ncbi:hypothetical protein [Marinomonas mediterranea]|jgi:hypothetical protein|uniref:Uncharacterized protein n=1 Tax=Marinomonas mediterranea (strain ATCC 700492 / JCM 21426 / NBRC 103028 / MMB-1) TaxID=717774 RepID=F2JYB5_MARM1|nr:hypothetical protein [Marinomonas mediterranea]ADZ91946.1 hypothetical protein Marme_2716 [Marinomonas mediterranea MMB-1]WCN09899.1 hypothetical protein GV055_13720 [Marinomonas mediterranea]WCN13979.1 hypothetical protein GV054_13710 [Marinomonas mediterranea]WCN18029.1 hypothetical protein GV053_13735 [Marinomonas mediterranea MMB-1]